MMIANLTSKTTVTRALVEGVTPFNDALQMMASTLNMNTDTGRLLTASSPKAAMIAYLNDFKLLMILTLIMVPPVMLIGTAESSARQADEPVHAMD